MNCWVNGRQRVLHIGVVRIDSSFVGMTTRDNECFLHTSMNGPSLRAIATRRNNNYSL